MSFEQLLILAVFVLVPLLNALVRALKRRIASPAGRESRPQPPETPVHGSPPYSPPSRRRDEARGTAEPPRTEVLQSRRRPRVRIGSAKDMRRAVVLMTVLERCLGLGTRGASTRDDR